MSLGDRPFRLGPWRLDPMAFEATRGAETVRLEPKAVAVLMSLAERPGAVVSREALLDAVWPDVVVTDASLTRCVSQLRQVLGDDPRAPALIETIPKAGYRLLVAPEPVAEAAGVAAPPPASGRRPAGRSVLAVALVVALAWGATMALGPPPALDVAYRVDAVGDVDGATVTVTGADGRPVTVRPAAFPFTSTIVPTKAGGTFRLQVRGRSSGADLVLTIVASRGADEVARHETRGTVETGPAEAFTLVALLTLDE